jgi:hypothetical protein
MRSVALSIALLACTHQPTSVTIANRWSPPASIAPANPLVELFPVTPHAPPSLFPANPPRFTVSTGGFVCALSLTFPPD